MTDMEVKQWMAVTENSRYQWTEDEITRLYVVPNLQGRGYGRAMVEEIIRSCRGHGTRLLVGTGDSPLTVPFYKSCGFQESHRVKTFHWTDYDHPIFEAGRQLVDMVYLAMDL